MAAVPTPLFEAERVTRRYREVPVVDEVSLTVAAGEIVGLLGPNGAGKTTLIRMAATLARPSAGVLRYRGVELKHATPAARGWIGFASHQSLLYPELTVAENLRFHRRLHGARTDIGELLERHGLTAVAGVPARHLSRGTAQRATLARALLHEPDLLLLDEPFAGLDGAARERLAGMVRDAAHEPRADGAEAVHALDPKHGAGVGAAKIVRADVVGRREAGKTAPHLVAGGVPQRPAHHRGDLSLVIEPVTVGGPHHASAVGVERAHGFREVRRGLAVEVAAELDGARAKVEVHADDLLRLARRQVDRVRFRQPAAVRERERLAVRLAPLGPAVEQDAAALPPGSVENAHGAPPAASCGTVGSLPVMLAPSRRLPACRSPRSKTTCAWPVPRAFS